MTIHVIVYSKATGRVRRVVAPQGSVPPVATVPGEATLIYTQHGGGVDTAVAWQAAVNGHTGLSVAFPPDATSTDWYCGIDGSNNIKWWGIADPACADAVAGLRLLSAPFGADGRWTYDGTTFAAPQIVTKSRSP